MREIKFRAWNKNSLLGPVMTTWENIMADPEAMGLLILNKFQDSIPMQYTGLKDKNGKEIYEGDIIRYETNYYGNNKISQTVIEWQNDLEHDGFGEPLAMGYIFRGYNIEVIGNIYENPELLEKNEA